MNTTPPDLQAFKEAFRRHAAGVAIVTARTPEGEPVGFTATSLASLSAVPPLATFNTARSSSTWPALTATNHVAIHMLGARNKPVAVRMSGDRSLRFSEDVWADGPYGLPVFRDATAWIAGEIIERFPVHNNAIVVVRIEKGELGEPDAPLIYHERSYYAPGDAL